MTGLEVRAERPEDFDAIRAILLEAFGPESPEADLVDALRAEGAHVPELCLVAVHDGKLAGHVCFTRARLDSGQEVLSLAPMAVLPAMQRRGIGSRLVRESLRRAALTDFPLVVVMGHPAYYPRFGFEPAADLGIRSPYDAPPEAWMVHRLPAYRPEVRGLVEYPEAFRALD
jgi:predicted N-acetyltransferase YhbS